MTIEDEGRFIQSLPDWAMLAGCFGDSIKPSDIDGWVERNGRCLFLEHKRSGAPLKRGQNRGFRALAAQGNEVIVFWGDARDGSDMTHMLVHRLGVEAQKIPAGLSDLRAECERWFHEANEAVA